MTDPFGMTDAELVDRYRRALAEIMTASTQNIWETVRLIRRRARYSLFGEVATISTDYDPPPIPDRRHDWSAIDDATYDPVGYGETEAEAILDLIDKMEAAQK